MESGKSLLRDDEDLQEEEVWAVVKKTRDYSSLKMMRRSAKEEYSSSGSGSAWHAPAVQRTNIPRSSNGGRGAQIPQQLSAPANMPDWSKKIHKNKGLRSDGTESNGDGYVIRNFDNDDDNEDDDDDDEMVPPHEYIARKLGRSNQIASFSMCEGVGRTLKGRDLSKLRNAILTKTGFIE